MNVVRKSIASAAIAVAAVTGVASAAGAATSSVAVNGARANATINFSNEWNGGGTVKVTDTASDGKCARGEVIYDLNNSPDQGVKLPEVCGAGKSYTSTVRWGGFVPNKLQGIYVKICKINNNWNDDCRTTYFRNPR